MPTVTRILLVGETWMTVKFNIKGVDIFPVGGYENYAVWFMEAMARFDDVQVEHMPNHVALGSFPSTFDQLDKYDVVVFSDVGKNTLMLYPEMFTVPMGPDRLALIRDYVTNGKAFVMAGGWNSYQGLNGIPGYHGTVIEEILPVEIQATDDRVETPQAQRPEILDARAPHFSRIAGRMAAVSGTQSRQAKTRRRTVSHPRW